MSALCFGETDAPAKPHRTRLQHSVDVTYEHAMLHSPAYMKNSFVANVFVIMARSLTYHLILLQL